MTRQHSFKLVMTSEERRLLEGLAERMGISMADVLRLHIREKARAQNEQTNQ